MTPTSPAMVRCVFEGRARNAPMPSSTDKLFDSRTKFEPGGHPGIRPRAPADADRGQALRASEARERIEKRVGGAIDWFVPGEPASRCHRGEADEEIERNSGGLPVQLPGAASLGGPSRPRSDRRFDCGMPVLLRRTPAA